MVKKVSKKSKARKNKPRKDKLKSSESTSLDEYLYVAIEDLRAFRVSILESSKAFIENLKSYQRIQAINKQKKALVENITKNIKDIESSLSKIQSLLPTKLVRKTEKIIKKQSASVKKQKHKKESTTKEVDRESRESFREVLASEPSSDVDKLFDTVQERLSELK